MKNRFNITPGNWSVNTTNKEVISIETDSKMSFGSDSSICGIHIADIAPEDRHICLADAYLISAAPDFLEACLEFVRNYESGESKNIHSYKKMKSIIEKVLGLPKNKNF